MDPTDTQATFSRAANGCNDAAQEIHERYVHRLVALARTRLSEKLARKFDPDDVVQSAFRSFFHRARDGQYEIQRAGELWSLLASITRHKLLKKAELFDQEKRKLVREEALSNSTVESESDSLHNHPTNEEAVALSDEVEYLMRSLEPIQRDILEQRLCGKPIDTIAESVDRSERTVRRFLASFTEQLSRRLQDLQDG